MSDSSEHENSPGSPISGGQILKISLPPSLEACQESLKALQDSQTRVEQLRNIFCQDPVIVLEVIRRANTVGVSQTGASTATIGKAIVALGMEQVKKVVEEVSERQSSLDPECLDHLEQFREKAIIVSGLSKVIALQLNRQIADACQTSSLFSTLGDMLIVASLKKDYIELANSLQKRSKITYRLHHDFGLSPELLTAQYLHSHGIPNAIISAVHRDSVPQNGEEAKIKGICFAAMEIFEHFEMDRIDKIEPGKSLPPKSALRMLMLSEADYSKLFESAMAFLESGEEGEEVVVEDEHATIESLESDETSLDSALETEAVNDLDSAESDVSSSPLESLAECSAEPDDVAVQEPEPEPRVVRIIEESFEAESESRIDSQALVAPPLIPKKMEQKIQKVSRIFEKTALNAHNSERLITDLLSLLVEEGSFEKSALLVVSEDRKSAMVVAARGQGVEETRILEIKDELSPLAKGTSKVVSFSAKEGSCSPFRSKTYALAPIKVDYISPVVLYADCGHDAILTFESRQIFRKVVDLLNDRLKVLPGSIPIEQGA